MHRRRVAIIAAMLSAIWFIAPASADTLDKVKSSGTFLMGVREASPPFSSVGAEGKPEGFSIDLCQRIAAAVKQKLALDNLDIKFVPVTAENRIEKLESGEIDIECGSTSRTLSRQARVDFTLFTFVTGTDLLVRSDAPINNVTELQGKKIALLPGTTNETVVKKLLKFRLIDAEIVAVKDHDDGVSAVEDGRADVYASDQVLLIGQLMKAKHPTRLRLNGSILSYEPYALMVRKNDADFRLVADRALASLYQSGEIGTIYDRWFGRWRLTPSDLLGALYEMQSLSE